VIFLSKDRFQRTHTEGSYSQIVFGSEIIKDSETGVSYLVTMGNGIGITPLLDADGKPLVDKSE